MTFFMEESFKPFYFQGPGDHYSYPQFNYDNCGTIVQTKEPAMPFRNAFNEAPPPPLSADQAAELSRLSSNHLLECMVEQASQELAALNCNGGYSDTSQGYNSQTLSNLSGCNSSAPTADRLDSTSSPEEISSHFTVQPPCLLDNYIFDPSAHLSRSSSSSSAPTGGAKRVRRGKLTKPVKAGHGGHIVQPQQEDEAMAQTVAQTGLVMDSILREHFPAHASSEPSSHPEDKAAGSTGGSDHPAILSPYNHQTSQEELSMLMDLREMWDAPLSTVESAVPIECPAAPPASSPSTGQLGPQQAGTDQDLSALAVQLRITSFFDERDFNPTGEFRGDSRKGKQQKISGDACVPGSGGGAQDSRYNAPHSGLSTISQVVPSKQRKISGDACVPGSGGGAQDNRNTSPHSGLSTISQVVPSSSAPPIMMQTDQLLKLPKSCRTTIPPALTRKRVRNDPTGETQRITHIEVERNRRKQMNERLAILQSLMPPGFVLKTDQASIIGAAGDFVKELELVYESLQSKKRRRAYAASSRGSGSSRRRLHVISPSAQSLSASANEPGYSSEGSARPSVVPRHVSSHRNLMSTELQLPAAQNAAKTVARNQAQCSSPAAAVEVEVVGTHAIVDITTHWRAKQGVRVIAAIENLDLTIQHATVTTSRNIVLYKFYAKVGPRYNRMTVHQLAGAIHQNLVHT